MTTLFVFNSIEHITISGNALYDLSDHLPNFIILNRFSDVSSNTELYRRDYSNFNQSVFLDDVRSVDWQSILECDSDPSRMFDSIYQTLLQIVDRHIPATRQLSKSEQKFYSKPWITPALKTSIRVKNALYRKHLETKSVNVHCKFKYHRNRLSHLLRVSKKRLYYNNYFLMNINNSKKVWNGIRDSSL